MSSKKKSEAKYLFGFGGGEGEYIQGAPIASNDIWFPRPICKMRKEDILRELEAFMVDDNEVVYVYALVPAYIVRRDKKTKLLKLEKASGKEK